MSATPIFDLEKAVPEPSKSWLYKSIGVALGAAVATTIILEDQNRLPGWNWPAFNGLLLIPALYVAIAVHEIGHLIAASLVGINSGGIAIGGFVFIKSGKNWVFRFNWRAWAGGFFKPLTGTAGFHRSRYAWMVVGGPLASCLLTVLCGFIAARYGSGSWYWIGTLFWSSLLTALISAVPYSSGSTKSDGALLRLLLTDPNRSSSWMALLALQTEEAHGLRPREWNADLVEQ